MPINENGNIILKNCFLGIYEKKELDNKKVIIGSNIKLLNNYYLGCFYTFKDENNTSYYKDLISGTSFSLNKKNNKGESLLFLKKLDEIINKEEINKIDLINMFNNLVNDNSINDIIKTILIDYFNDFTYETPIKIKKHQF